MCLDSVELTKKFVDGSRTKMVGVGYKIVRKRGDHYYQLFYTIGSQKSDYRVYNYCAAGAHIALNHPYEVKGHSVIGIDPYEVGFHVLSNLVEANTFLKWIRKEEFGIYYGDYAILEVEYDGITNIGKQEGARCVICNQIKFIREIPEAQDAH